MTGAAGHLTVPGYENRVRVTARYVETVDRFPGERQVFADERHNCYKVRFDWRRGPTGRRAATFDFVDSMAGTFHGRSITPESLRHAVESVFVDALDGMVLFKEFEAMHDWTGLTPAERRRRWRACLNTRLKLNQLGLSNEMIREVANGRDELFVTSDDGRATKRSEPGIVGGVEA